MTAFRRIRTKAFGAALVVGAAIAMPALAQNSQQPVDVTSAPAPSADTVGPSQLRDFSLGGPSTRPSPQPAQPAEAAPVAEQPVATRPAPASSAASGPQPGSERLATTAQPVGTRPGPVTLEPPSPSRTLPLDVVTPGNSTSGQPTVADVAPAPPVSSSLPDGVSPWPWLAALLAAIAAGAVWWWSRRHRSERLADPGRMAFAGGAAEAEAAPPAPRAVASQPQPKPAEPAPVPAAAQPKPVSSGLITSSALKPVLELHFVPDRLVITDREAIVQFDLVIANVGSAAARNVLVEGLLVCASPVQDQEIAQFFQHPRGTGDRIPGIAPMDSLTLKSAVRLTLDQVRSFEAGGRTLFVPLVAFNMLYGANDQQVSASYLVGRGKEGDEKLAPFRLDMGPRIFRGLSARPHSSGLSAAA